MHIRSDGTPVTNAIYPMLETEFTRNPRLVEQIDFINEDPRELAVYVGQSALINGQVFHAKAIVGENEICQYGFVDTVILPGGLGILGICG